MFFPHGMHLNLASRRSAYAKSFFGWFVGAWVVRSPHILCCSTIPPRRRQPISITISICVRRGAVCVLVAIAESIGCWYDWHVLRAIVVGEACIQISVPVPIPYAIIIVPKG
jgi:hypothetical protein